MATLLTKVAQVGLKSGGKFAAKTVARTGAKKVGKAAGKKGAKSLANKLVKSQAKNALLDSDIGGFGGSKSRKLSPSPGKGKKGVRIKSPSPSKKKKPKPGSKISPKSKSTSRTRSKSPAKKSKSKSAVKKDKDKTEKKGLGLNIGGFGSFSRDGKDKESDEKISDKRSKDSKKRKDKWSKGDSDTEKDEETEIDGKKPMKKKEKKKTKKESEDDSETEIEESEPKKGLSKKSIRKDESESENESKEKEALKDKKARKKKGTSSGKSTKREPKHEVRHSRMDENARKSYKKRTETKSESSDSIGPAIKETTSKKSRKDSDDNRDDRRKREAITEEKRTSKLESKRKHSVKESDIVGKPRRKTDHHKSRDDRLYVKDTHHKTISSDDVSGTMDSNRSNRSETSVDDNRKRKSRIDGKHDEVKSRKHHKKRDPDRHKRERSRKDEKYRKEKERKRKKSKKHKDKEDHSESESDESLSRKRKSPTFKRKDKTKSKDIDQDAEICFKVRDGRLRTKDSDYYCAADDRPVDQMSKSELNRLIKEYSTTSGKVNIEKLAQSLVKRTNLTPQIIPKITITPPVMGPSMQLTKEEIKAEEKCAKIREKAQKAKLKMEKRSSSPIMKGFRSRFRSSDSYSDRSSRGTLTPNSSSEYICQSIQSSPNIRQPPHNLTPPGQTSPCSQMSQQILNGSVKPEENDEWLRAFEMVVKYDNAKDIRATQLKQEEMKLESKYLKQGQAKHFKRSRNSACNARPCDSGCEEYVDVERGRDRSKLDHLYDLIYALRGAPKGRLVKGSNQDYNATNPQIIPVYVPWELPQGDPYAAYYSADGSGYDPQAYYQQNQ